MSSAPVVALFSVGELYGGVERHLLCMCEWFRRQGIDPLLVLLLDNELAEQARLLGITPVILENRGGFDLVAPRRLGRLLKDRQVNVVHAHGYRAVVNAALAGRYHRFVLVRTVHGMVEPSRRLSPGWFKSRLYNWLEETASARTDSAICHVTEDLRRRREASYGSHRSLTVYNGIDPAGLTSYPRPAELPEGVFHFAAVGRVSPVKNLQTALLAVQKLDPDLNAVLNIIGTGPSLGGLQALAESLRLGSRVRFLGFRKNVYDYLAHVDALVMPSHHEGLPYTILETMSLGTPIIAARVGGLPEILEDGRTALLVDPDDVEAWAAAMTELATHPDRAARMGDAGRQDQARSYTLDTMGASYWRVYLEELERNLPHG